MNFDGYKKEFKISKWHCIEPLIYVESAKIESGFKQDLTKPIQDIDVFSTKPAYMKDSILADNFYLGVHGGISPIHTQPFKNILDELSVVFDDVLSNWKITKSWCVSYNRGSFIWPHHHMIWAKGEQELNNTLSGVVCLASSPGDGTLRFEDDTYYDQTQGDVLLFDSKLVHWCDVIHDPKVVLSFDIAIREPV